MMRPHVRRTAGHSNFASLLQKTLDEEKATDRKTHQDSRKHNVKQKKQLNVDRSEGPVF